MKDLGNGLVVVAYYTTSHEAEIVQALLSSFKIYTELINKTASEILPISTSEEFQVKLLANQSDVERINEILNAKFKESDLTNEFK